MAYVCQECGYSSLGWEGKCSSCGAWGTMSQFNEAKPKRGKSSVTKGAREKVSITEGDDYISYGDLLKSDEGIVPQSTTRLLTGYSEFDRVLGGGFVPGELILLSGDPGIGKSTLALQVAFKLSQQGSVAYVSGEESRLQFDSRVARLFKSFSKGRGKSLELELDFKFSTKVDLPSIESLVSTLGLKLLVVDSLQTLYLPELSQVPGSLAQLRAVTWELSRIAREFGCAILVVGQVTKEGVVAGPRMVEHMVDCVVYLEGEVGTEYRILRAVKNRFGPINEMGIFEMTEQSLAQVANPSSIFLSNEASEFGVTYGALLSGSRSVLFEVQVLIEERGGDDLPVKRVVNGYKRARLEMLAAVMGRYGKLKLRSGDIYLNIFGGLSVDSSAADLAVCAALKSAKLKKSALQGYVYLGEVGLSGMVRPFYGIERVVKEIERLGYAGVVMPSQVQVKSKSLKVVRASSVKDLP